MNGISPNVPVFDTRKLVKWEWTRSSTRMFAKIYGFTNNTSVLRGVRFATDVDVQTVVYKVLRPFLPSILRKQ